MDSNITEQLNAFMKNITNLRKKHNLSKTKMAKILGVGVKTLEKMESGEFPKRVSSRILFRIQDYFNILPSEHFHTHTD